MIDARDTALVIEGGGMRNSYTAAAIVKLINEQVQFGWVGGVSAGASHMVNYLSGDADRARSSFTDFANNPSFGGLGHFVRGRGYFNAEFIYEKAADGQLPFDFPAFQRNPARMSLSATRADTGETVYWSQEDIEGLPDLMMRVRASSTLPLIMPMRVIDGVPYVDGALGNSGGLVIEPAEKAGFTKFLVVASRPRDYVRGEIKNPRMMRATFRKHPAIARGIIRRPAIYNAAKQHLLDLERQGSAQLFFPTHMSVESTERKAAKLEANYQLGHAQVAAEWPEWEKFLTK